jgi:hypothetical protein
MMATFIMTINAPSTSKNVGKLEPSFIADREVR